MDVHTLEDLFIDELRDIYDAEKRILEGLVKMETESSSGDLRSAFRVHQNETQDQIERLERIFEICDTSPEGEQCQATIGLLREADRLLGEVDEAEVRDAALIAMAQKIEHYEIATYGTLRTLARQLGKDECAALLDKTLEEEKQTDERLSNIAIAKINQRAAA